MKIEIELLPMHVPDYVLQKQVPRPRQLGFTEAIKYHISDLPSQTLSALCDEFRNAVFEKAGKKDPRLIPCCDPLEP